MSLSSSSRLGSRISLIIFSCLFVTSTQSRAAAFADSVVEYASGVGFAEEYGTGLGYTLPESALGAPNPDTGFGSLNPFNPPFSRQDLLSMGEGGHLTVRFDSPLLNHTDVSFGMDFIIYGSTGFIDVDYPNGVSDDFASIFSQSMGETRVSVSPDNVTYYVLDATRAPLVDGYFPTDSQGQFGVPMNPNLDPADFANLSLDQIRDLYGDSAGGTAYDLAWALDESGEAVDLKAVSYVRIDVLSGRSEIDALAVVVPEPASLALWTMTALVGCVFGRWRLNRRRRG